MEVKSEIDRSTGYTEEKKIKVVLNNALPCPAIREFQEGQAWERPDEEENMMRWIWFMVRDY